MEAKETKSGNFEVRIDEKPALKAVVARVHGQIDIFSYVKFGQELEKSLKESGFNTLMPNSSNNTADLLISSISKSCKGITASDISLRQWFKRLCAIMSSFLSPSVMK